MSHSNFSSRGKYVVFALVNILALAAVTFFLSGCSSAGVPITGNQQSVSDLGLPKTQDQGKFLTTAPVGSLIFSGQPSQRIDSDFGLGTIIRLETNTQGVQVVTANTAAGWGNQRYKLGAGYWLVITDTGGEIIPPTGSSTENRQVDLGEGYRLTITGSYARVIPPNTRGSLFPLPHDPNVNVESIGKGFWLVTDPNGDWIWQEETK